MQRLRLLVMCCQKYCHISEVKKTEKQLVLIIGQVYQQVSCSYSLSLLGWTYHQKNNRFIWLKCLNIFCKTVLWCLVAHSVVQRLIKCTSNVFVLLTESIRVGTTSWKFHKLTVCAKILCIRIFGGYVSSLFYGANNVIWHTNIVIWILKNSWGWYAS